MDFLIKNWMLVLIALLSGGMLIWPIVFRRLTGMKDIGPQQATLLANNREAVLLDVRETAEYQGGRLPRALHVPLSQLSSRIGELTKFQGRPVVVYCHRGSRSQMAGMTLKKAGHGEIYSLAGGIEAWKQAGLPIEKA
jgi:rhodanese-related sulfurtransferase